MTRGPDGDWCIAAAKGGAVRLAVQVLPNAKKNDIVGALDGHLKIRLQAQPVEGKANAALGRYLAELLGVPKTAVEVTHGLTARRKLVEVRAPHLTVDRVKAVLLERQDLP